MKNLMLSLLLFPLFLVAQPSRFSFESYEDGSNELKYRLLYPYVISGKKLPLVVFLHGSGERGDDNDAQLKWGVMQFATDEAMKNFPAFVVAPQCPKKDSWYNGKGKSSSKPLQMVRALIDEMIKNHPVDINRIYITGLSMGGYGTFDALARYPDLFAAAVPVCGGGDPKTAKNFKDVPVWIFTGAEDSAVPAERSLEMLNALMEAGAKPGYTQLPETGHFSWLAAYTDQMMMQWLFRQRK
ncbi:MAG: prolyl oligopeptidase family serine peptidase [Bacteroidota bacterium]